MKHSKAKLIALILILMISGCSKVISYTPSTTMSIKDATETVEELIMTQHSAWKPDYVQINDKFISWDYGSQSSSKGSAALVGIAAFGKSSTKTRSLNERVYFHSIKDVRLQSWKRKFKQWYVVSIVENDGIKNVFYTRDINDAKRFVNAFESLVVEYK